jgi:hypothetical protein
MVKPSAGYRPLAYSSPEAVQTTGTTAKLGFAPDSLLEGDGFDASAARTVVHRRHHPQFRGALR